MQPRSRALSPATQVVAGGRPERLPGAPAVVPPVFSSTYVQDGAVAYGRFGNPTWAALEEVLGTLDGGTATAYGSGTAAVSAVLDRVPVGGTVVAPVGCYSGTLVGLERLHRLGRVGEVRLVDPADTAAVVAALPGADLLWVESPTNPLLAVADLPALVAAAYEVGALVAVDATFCSPLVLRPLDLGADVVVHSATKYLAGHSDALLGVAVTRSEELSAALVESRSAGGAIPGTMEAWLVLRGLRTLHLRVERSQANALELARRLEGHPALERVRYPGLASDPGHARATEQLAGYGSIVCLDVRGGAEPAERLVAGCRLWLPATSLGGVESTLERRRRHAAESADVPEGLVRLSVGVEDVEDLWADLSDALDAR
ncbi:cystathionine gamma-synthase [Motilibacter rhizosphaerae]|uniref:Cystathionine gamma-synthase n=1 Tax=Motilibacter rhizosphaerae TaxID=598652 RepID=A0A4Q7NP34_9ACTN|nr:aminotransferase class I/II-fold pyridoxal phosphate-dependent enzyme [Motilibacter rhizosphaerae]RZS87015.1 cystathionine gamma-synthase [Motilibacter rhizosphaerae]